MSVIVVIDNEPPSLDLTSTVLRLAGHEVKTVADPSEACAAIIAAASPIDLLITDIDMKPIPGFQVVNRLRKERIDCPVLVISDNHGLAALTIESLGPRAMMRKPFTAAALCRAAREIVATDKWSIQHAVY